MFFFLQNLKFKNTNTSCWSSSTTLTTAAERCRATGATATSRQRPSFEASGPRSQDLPKFNFEGKSSTLERVATAKKSLTCSSRVWCAASAQIWPPWPVAAGPARYLRRPLLQVVVDLQRLSDRTGEWKWNVWGAVAPAGARSQPLTLTHTLFSGALGSNNVTKEMRSNIKTLTNTFSRKKSKKISEIYSCKTIQSYIFSRKWSFSVPGPGFLFSIVLKTS